MQTPSLESLLQMREASAPNAAPKFRSILFEQAVSPTNEMPEFFWDLNLDQIVEAITAGRHEYNLKPLFYTRLTGAAEIAYRHEIMRDLENADLFQCVRSFSDRLRSMRASLAAVEKSYSKHEKEGWFLEAAATYGDATETLLRDLQRHDPHSRGLRAFRVWLAEHTATGAFQSLAAQARKLKSELSAIRYSLLIRGGSVTVGDYNGEPDYSTIIEEVFAKFKRDAPKDYRVSFPQVSGMDHVGAMILERVAWLHPDVFAALEEYCAQNTGFVDETIARFDREIQFYGAWLEYAAAFQRVGLKFCYPRVSDASKNVRSRDSFDLALAGKLVREKATVICNDFELTGPQRILVVTGPNHGGKTTFARTSANSITRRASACRWRARRRSCFGSTGCSRTSSARKTSPIFAANWKPI